MNALAHASPTLACDPLHASFLAILPRIERHGQVYFRHLACPDKREEALAEMRGLSWKWYVRLHQRGKDPARFVSAIATYAARAVRSGRRVCGHEKANDVLSPVAQRRHGFAVEPLPYSTSTSHDRLYGLPSGQEAQDAFEERLHDNTVTPPPEQAAFRIDFPAWRLTRSERDRRLVDELIAGGRTKDVSATFGISPGRVSQLRRDFMEDWNRFTGAVA
jgi:hypothetical protein